MQRILLSLLLASFLPFVSQAGTFDDVVSIMNTSCAFSTCHDSDNPAAGLDFSLSANEIHTQLINIVPQNPVAASKNNKLVKPGDPARSFLYRKMNYGLHEDSNLETGENQPMPTGGQLEDHQIELVRQWILFGAKNDGQTYIDPELLEEYYTDGGLDMIEAPAPPAVGRRKRICLSL